MADYPSMDDNEIQYGMVLEEAENEDYQPRLKNKGKIQRTKVTGFDQRLPMVVYGLRDDTIHGTDTKGTPCSLMVFRWYLHQREPKKRFKSLRINIVFSTTKKNGSAVDHWYDPSVRTVAPDGTYSLMHTTNTVEQKVTTGGNISGGFGGPSAGVKVGYELTQSVETTDQIIINGKEYSDYEGDAGEADRCNAVEFNLFENISQKSGLPTFFRTAILVERRKRDTHQFTATVTTVCQVSLVDDASRKFKDLIGVIPKDDPIIFDPKKEETSQFSEFKERLDEVSLEEHCKFIMYRAETAPKVLTKDDMDSEQKGEQK